MRLNCIEWVSLYNKTRCLSSYKCLKIFNVLIYDFLMRGQLRMLYFIVFNNIAITRLDQFLPKIIRSGGINFDLKTDSNSKFYLKFMQSWFIPTHYLRRINYYL